MAQPKDDQRRREFVEPLFDAFFLHYYLKATFATVTNQKFTYLAIFKRLGKTIKVSYTPSTGVGEAPGMYRT
jgi:hypothetical protein